MTTTKTPSNNTLPDFKHEIHIKKQGFYSIAGIDEAGRGSLAGPVVAAAVILNEKKLPQYINDSKKLTPKQRQEIFDEILHLALAVGIASLCARTIDAKNIRQATLKTMQHAVLALPIQPDYALIDGKDIPKLPCHAQPIIKGDQQSLSIAAASIIAKVTRDHMMKQANTVFPAYGFDKHVGYGTKKHLLALENYGKITKLHRFSFAPIKNMM